jgi:hypothetical protein
MKKILFLLIISVSFVFPYGFNWSSGVADGMDLQGLYDDYIKNLNDRAKQKYDDLNNNQVKDILDGFEKKKKLLSNMQNLSREDDITETNQLHEIELKRELDGLLIDTWSVE